ncbi:hypothetical protein Tco_0524095 [Tanacetum coccineum]
MKICPFVFRHWNWTSNGTCCSKGTRIILGWNHNDVDIVVINQDDQSIHVRVWLKVERKELFCTFVYAHNKYTQRRSLWNNLRLHKHYVRDRPWCILGDFNAALFLHDYSVGNSRIDISMREFKECVEDLEVMDVQHSGLQYTWTQKPKGNEGLLKKIDRVMANLMFNDVFAGSHAIFKPYRNSDHAPSVLCIPTMIKPKPKPFKFYNLLTCNDNFKKVVSDGWSTQVSGFHMFRVTKKLKMLKKPLRKLLYDKGNLHNNVNQLRNDLDQVQIRLDVDPFNESIREEEAMVLAAFNDACLMQEKFLKQKAKIDWLREGDSNSAYFHKLVKSRTSRSRIDVVTSGNGEIFENDQVATAFVSYYEMFLGQPGITSGFCATGLFRSRLNEDVALNMTGYVTRQEVKSALFFIGNDKAPGPDGYTVAFFKESWDIVADDFVDAVCEFFTNGKLLRELNHTIIALIPKVINPTRVTDYRPISCCNVMFKCISKIIANCIKESLKTLVSPNQSAFILGRSIADNILLTQELMHNHHLDRGVPRCAFKVDIQKAYDTVDWDFLKNILAGFGFHDRMIGWIMECVTTTSFSISINGSLHGFFKGKCGLRQGDPLSPYLFTLVMEILTLMLQRGVSNANLFSYHRYCSKLKLINLCFADDLFLFSYGDTDSVKVIKEAFNEFKEASGLILPFKEGYLPVKYLGVPLVTSRLVFRDCKELIEKFHARVDDWKNKFLSAAVAWDVVCLPKDEGGLGVRRDLEDDRSSSLTLEGRRKELSWGWRKVLQLRPLIRDYIGFSISDGDKASLWFDNWSTLGPLADFISSRDRHVAGLNASSKVCDVFHDGIWNWPASLCLKYPQLQTIQCRSTNASSDCLEWRNEDGQVKAFSVSMVWATIRHRNNKIDWYAVVWFPFCIPRHAFNLWLVIKQKLKTQDKVASWEVSDSLMTKSHKSVVAKLVLAASAYFIWQERNWRLYKKNKRTVQQVRECIYSTVRLKLLSCRFKKSKSGASLAQRWNLPHSCFV